MAAEDLVRGGPLDCTHLVVTPENVRFDYRVAGPFPRAVAFVIDCFVIVLVIFIVAMVFSFTVGEAATGLILILIFVLQWGYASILETFWNGQTVGKRALKLRVVSENGLPINGRQAVLRTFLRTADLVPYGIPGTLSMLFSSRFQRIGDRVAGTMVVVEGKQGRISPPKLQREFKLSPAIIPAKFRGDPALTKALTLYVSRHERLSLAGRREIAWYLARHFIRLWSLPEETDPDELLCLLYAELMRDDRGGAVKPARMDTKKRLDALKSAASAETTA